MWPPAGAQRATLHQFALSQNNPLTKTKTTRRWGEQREELFVASNYTTNYQLNQWEAGDQVLRTEFNQDNQKIDTALKSNAEAIAAEVAARTALETVVGQCGNCSVVYGSYAGNGLAGASYPNTLTFSGKPLAVFLMPQERYGSSNSSITMLRGVIWTQYHPEALATICTVTWGEDSVSWYHAGGDVQSQFSMAGATYHYVAFLIAEE